MTFLLMRYHEVANTELLRLASAELYHMTAQMVLRVIPRARLFETTIEDITYDHDLIVVQTKKGSISVRIKID